MGIGGKVPGFEDSGGMIRTALFSPCRKYRHSLVRIWQPDNLSLPMGCIIEKNPSNADEKIDDATMKRNIAFGYSWNWRGLLQQNVSDYIATHSNELCGLSDSLWVSPENLIHRIIERIRAYGCTQIVCAWGTHSNRTLRERIQQRGDMIVRRLREAGFEPMCLKVNKDGTPAHTLYLHPDLKPIPYRRGI